MTLESALIPIPSEITMPFSGFLVNQGSLSFFWVGLVGAFGNLIGSLIGYYIGFLLEENLLLALIKKYGKFILLTEEDYKKSTNWFIKYGNGVVFFSRLMPAVRTFISLPAGVFKMNIWKFSFYTFTGSLIWSFVLTFVGLYFGTKWNTLEVYFRKFDLAVFILSVLAILFFVNRKLKIIKKLKTS